MLTWRLSKYSEIKLQTTWFYLTQSFLKKQKQSGTNFPVSFSMILKEKYFCWDILLTDKISLSGWL